ncbi:GNAT family N-acetyltransferase [Aliidiomarina taiwanensis]|uniref:GNAT family N-acetyltransferase n=1 Tax=Aliidiomarina taiwanensis TaxID=946228 RepID=A0A432WW41_9GAMM|nr:GNAT family N-acetyltransferase [Aliidiomarina taiwanensis]RUO37957.1 GNAT family N-acetyltransferase [Aliidiomarina taiwanensis]
MTLSWCIKPFSELTRTELYQVLRVRQEVFVVEQNCPYSDIDDTDAEWFHVLGRAGEQVVAYARLRLDASEHLGVARIGRVLVTENARGKGVARELMQRSMDYIHQHAPGRTIAISAQCYLLDFYRSLGFQNVGEPYDEDGIPHQDMEWRP